MSIAISLFVQWEFSGFNFSLSSIFVENIDTQPSLHQMVTCVGVVTHSTIWRKMSGS